ncbi:uncharacterized protein C8Q71DRAFT_361743 [Rhodofomes roseus]|uniref:Protein SMG7 n=1 Tax=Rhodofomes roseus TaxID=34475 RepID=A0ABQ8K1N5_9APHY|nr:uncharacterized protein C8Q71DRAFT_361743 [Rhodofomes roseus]KAH9830631.1 hypothetical protein C8Q71DRAFT_361743 [Rhodofomes roseus]
MQTREAKSLQQGLKDSLKSRDPWDKEVEFQRKNLRRQYLRLLFVHPHAAESRDVDTHLWMSTSYQFISKYKERIANLDRAINRHQQQQGSSRQQSGQQRVVEHRKLLQRFSQFLSEEHRFWRQLVVRIHRVFALEDASRALEVLHIEIEQVPAAADGAIPRRSQHQFPPEADVASPSAPAERQTMIAVMSKALVCLGDIERYKELYNEKGGRPRAGHEEGPSAAPTRGGRGRRGGGTAAGQVPRMRNYEKAQHCYEQARLLLPNDGNPSHQLAILATYQRDTFGSLVQYYRSLCVKNRYEPASENMDTTLARAWEQWKAKEARRSKEADAEGGAETGPVAPRLRVEVFKEKVIVMHAMWRVSTEDITPSLQAHSQKVVDSFKDLVSERILPLDMIWKVVILAQGALWRHRSTRHPTRNLTHGNKLANAIAIESHIATHILALHRALLKVGIVQVAEASQEDGGRQDLAQSITAEFRRALPALRLASKWLRVNFKYVLEQSRADPVGRAEAHGSTEASGSSDRRLDKRQESRRRSNIPNVTISGVQEFWHAYVEFSTALLCTFPLERLPALSVPLDEDIETTGFLPLKRATPAETGSPGTSVSSPGAAQGSHPNTEFLMRIQELSLDAQAIAEEETSPFLLVDGHFVMRGFNISTFTTSARPVSTHPPNGHRVVGTFGEPSRVDIPSDQAEQINHDDDDDNRTEATRTDDDPVTLAFREALKTDSDEEEEEEEEDRIVYPRTDYQDVAAANPASSTPLMYATPRNVPLSSPPPLSPRLPRPNSPLVSISSPRGIAPISPPRHAPSNGNVLPPPAVTRPHGTTAEDLLMGLRRSNTHSRTPSAPQPQLLFGSGNATSIWSTERDRNPLGYRGTPPSNAAAFPSHQHTAQLSLPSTLSVDRSQNQYGDNAALPFPTQQPYAPFRGHQRISSLNLGLSQVLPSQGPSTHYAVSGGYAPSAEVPSALYQTGLSPAYVDPILSTPNSLLRHAYSPMNHQVSTPQRMLDTRVVRPPPVLPPSSLAGASQLWSNHG